MSDKNDGGQAFPNGDAVPGMTLRDWFAGQALAGIMTDMARQEKSSFPVTIKDVAQKSYQIADAMLEERK